MSFEESLYYEYETHFEKFVMHHEDYWQIQNGSAAGPKIEPYEVLRKGMIGGLIVIFPRYETNMQSFKNESNIIQGLDQRLVANNL